MSVITIRDANDNPVDVELPAAPGRQSASVSRSFTLSDEDHAIFRPPVLGVSADLSFGSTSAQSAVISGTRVRLLCRDANCRISVGANPTAPSDGTLLVAGIEYKFSITSGDKIAAIRDASTNGVLNITVIS